MVVVHLKHDSVCQCNEYKFWHSRIYTFTHVDECGLDNKHDKYNLCHL